MAKITELNKQNYLGAKFVCDEIRVILKKLEQKFKTWIGI